jgi:tetratricopeptide (TPR) repeat protein
MTSADAPMRHLVEQIRLLLSKDPIEGFMRWSTLFTQLRQAGQYDLCEELLHIIKGMEFPPYGLGIVRYSEGWLYDRSGQWEEAISAYEAALIAFADSGLPLSAEILVQIGSLYMDQGRWEAAEDAYDRAMVYAEERADRRARATVLNNLGGLWTLRKDHERASRYFREAIDEFAACGDQYNQAAATVGLAAILMDDGRLQDASDHLVKAISTFQDLGDGHGLATSVASLALTYHVAGRLPEARHNYGAAMEIFISVHDRIGIAKTLANMALVCRDMGDSHDAVGFLEQAIAEYREIRDHRGEALALVNLARVHQSRGDSAAIAAATTAAELCAKYGYHDILDRLREDNLDVV